MTWNPLCATCLITIATLATPKNRLRTKNLARATVPQREPVRDPWSAHPANQTPNGCRRSMRWPSQQPAIYQAVALPLLSEVVVSSVSLRLLLVALAVALLAATILVWQPWTGQLEGTVYYAACGGALPRNPPPGYKNCTTTIAPGAQVTASPAGGGSSSEAVADSGGRYSLRLIAGQFYLWGVTAWPDHVRRLTGLAVVRANTTMHVDVEIALCGLVPPDRPGMGTVCA